MFLLRCPNSSFFLSLSLSVCKQFVLPEYGAHGFLALIFLLRGEWTAVLWNLPLVAWNVNK